MQRGTWADARTAEADRGPARLRAGMERVTPYLGP